MIVVNYVLVSEAGTKIKQDTAKITTPAPQEYRLFQEIKCFQKY